MEDRIKKVLLATNNEGKIERFKKLLGTVDPMLEVFSPQEFGIEPLYTEENGKTLEENAELKARAYFGKTNIPILANDTGFFVEGEGLIDAPKREALGGVHEDSLSKEEITERLLSFWKGVAKKHGGSVDAAWVEAFIVLHPDGTIRKSTSRREVVLTDQEFGTAHPQMPVRALYYSKATNKPSLQHTPEEEWLELRPVTDALTEVLEISSAQT